MSNDAKHRTDPAGALTSYVSAFSNKDSAKIAGLLATRALIEIPMLRPDRLFGPVEIRRGHDAIFSNLDTISIVLGTPEAKGNIAIASGRLKVERNESIEESPVAIVAEMCEAGLARVSFYMEARNKRLWSDMAIF